MIIRKCVKEDLPIIAAIENACFDVAPWSLQNYVEDFENNVCSYILVAEQDEKIVGYIDFWIMFEQATIAKIAVLEPLRKYGIGNILLQEALAIMDQEGVTSVTLEVRVSNIAAIKLYEKNGFEIKLVKKGYYSDGEDAYFMMLGEC